MERKSMENIWKEKAWKIYEKGENLKMVVRGLKEWGISASMGLEIGQYASFLCGGDYRPCGAGGFVLWRGACFNTAVYSFYYFCI
jgi:hypothetical protein